MARFGLTHAEANVLSHAVLGLSHKAIAAQRGSCVGTVKRQARGVCRKLKARNLVDAVRIVLLEENACECVEASDGDPPCPVHDAARLVESVPPPVAA